MIAAQCPVTKLSSTHLPKVWFKAKCTKTPKPENVSSPSMWLTPAIPWIWKLAIPQKLSSRKCQNRNTTVWLPLRCLHKSPPWSHPCDCSISQPFTIFPHAHPSLQPLSMKQNGSTRRRIFQPCLWVHQHGSVLDWTRLSPQDNGRVSIRGNVLDPQSVAVPLKSCRLSWRVDCETVCGYVREKIVCECRW